MTKFFIAIALMPVGYALGFMLAAMLMFFGEGSVEQVPTPIAAKPPTSIAAKPSANQRGAAAAARTAAAGITWGTG